MKKLSLYRIGFYIFIFFLCFLAIIDKSIILSAIIIFVFYKFTFDMSWIKDIQALSISFKSIVVSIALFMPCWFLLLYYFFPDIINVEWYKMLMIVFVPSFIWYILGIGTVYFVLDLVETDDNRLTKQEFWVAIFLDGLLYLIIIGLIAYFIKLEFVSFALIAFLFRFLSLLLVGALSLFSNRREDKKVSQKG